MIPSSKPSRITSAPRSDSIPRIAGDVVGPSSGSIRPRNRRLVSTEQELVSTNSSTSTPGGSRAVSPIPQKHPSRGSSGDFGIGNGKARGRGPRSAGPVGGLLAPGSGSEGGKGGRGSPVGIGGFWDGGWMSSWSTLQGMASSVLGGTESDGNGSVVGVGSKAKGKVWGPESLPIQSDGGIGAGSTAERDAIVRRKKMTRVLEGREETPALLDTNGNYKRRTSMEDERPGSSQDDGDALVYIHHVQPNDTLAGVVLRYNCQPAVFRKANRFWPNDSIQIRKTVILPVDACTIKGRPCDPPSADTQGVDLLAPTPNIEDPPPFSSGTLPESSSPYDTSAARPPQDENPWIHVRWVLIDSSPNSKPVEIARMPRRTLGYFPPRRRKSQATISTISTPRASFDLPHPTLSQNPNDLPNSATSTPSRRISSLGPRPSQTSIPGSYFPPPPMTIATNTNTRARSSSITNPTSNPQDRFNWIRGPGGVGTLGKNVHTPGPGKDSINTWVQKHLPSIAISETNPPSSLTHTSTSTSTSIPIAAHFGFNDETNNIPAFQKSTTSTPGTNANVNVNGLGLENAAAAIEGWVRRLAVKAPGTPKGGGRVPESDLIELLDGTGSDDGRGFELSPSVGKGRGVGGGSAKGGKSD